MVIFLQSYPRRLFLDTASSVFPNLPNFKEEFYLEAKNSLERIDWEFPEYIHTVYDRTKKAEYKISGVMLTSYHEEYVTTRGDFRSYVWECNISLLKLLDDLMPCIFLLHDIYFNLKITQDSLEIKKIKYYWG